MGIRRAEFDRCFELEVLEPRVMLSADGMAAPMEGADTGPRIEVEAGAQEQASTVATDGSGMRELAAALMAAQANWINPAGGSWNDAANWEDGHVPEAGDDVTITGLNSDATLTLTGATPELASLSIDSGTLEITGPVFTEDLTLSGTSTLVINGEATSAITGEVTIAADATMSIQGSSTVSWSGSVWALAGELTFNSGTSFSQSAGRVEINTGGLFQVMEDAQTNSSGWSDFFVQGGTLRVDGTVTGTGNVEIIQYAGSLTGSGTISNGREIYLHGEVSPGHGAGDTGTLTIDTNVVFRQADGSDADWSIKLDIADAGNADRLVITGSAELNADGAITLNAASSDFGATDSGTLIDTDGRLITVGSTASTPTIQVLPGTNNTVVGTWDQANGRLVVETYSPINATWTNVAGGDWSDAANWANGRLPTAGESISITGLNSDAVVTLNGDTPVLTGLSLDSGTLAITGGLNTGDLTLTGSAVLTIEGAATSAITGDVSFATGTSFTVKDGGDLTWSGATWTQGGFAQIAEGGTFTQTAGRLEISASEQFAVNGTLNLTGGEFVVPTAGSALNLYNSGRLNVTGATVTLAGGVISAYNETVVTFTDGILSGAGTFKVNNQLNFTGSSTIKVGGAGSTGTLNFTQGEDASDGAISFSDAWAIQLEVLSSANADGLAFDSAVTFGASGAIAIDAASADFTGLAEGTALSDALTIDGTVTGTPVINVTAGETFSVEATFSGTSVTMTTVGNGILDSGGTTVVAGLTSATTTIQGMLTGFNLGTIDFSGQGRTAFTLPTLPGALADLFNLSELSSALALPGIGSVTTTPEAITALESAGYTVTTPGGGVDLQATLTRTVGTELTPTGSAFTDPDGFLAGIADSLGITAAFDLSASLIQHVVFELRDGVFNLLSDTYLALALAGGATLSGTVRQGDRSVTATGSTTFTDVEVRVINAAGGTTATGAGSVAVTLSLDSDPVTLSYTHTYSLSHVAETLITSTAGSNTLEGTLELPAVKDSEGNAAVFALTGTVAEDGTSWTLSGNGSDVEWLAFDVSAWSFDVSLNAGTFSGSGSFTTALDILSDSGTAPEVALSASFDQDSLTFTGTLDLEEIAVTNPAGGTYLSITDFSSTTSVSANLATGEWTGSLTFSGGDSSFAPAGAQFTATITDGDDADAYAVMGSYDFATQAFATSVDQFEMVAENIVGVVAAGVSLRHQRDVTEDQELISIEHVAVSLLFLKNQPSTGPPSVEAASISIRTNGITIGAGSLNVEELSLGSALTVTGVTVGFTEFSFLDGTLSTDSVMLSADAATLFPDGETFTASATNLSGTYEFSEPTDRLGLSAETLGFAIDGLVTFAATNLTLRPEGETIFSAETMEATLPAFDISGEIAGLEIASDGTPSATGFTLDTSGLAEKLSVGGILPFGIDGIDVSFLGDTNSNGLRDEGEVFRLDSFDLTVNGHFDFTAMASLPFTPTVKVGENEFDDSSDAFSFEVHVVEGTPQIWNTPTITLGIEELQIGNLVELGGSVTLGGYTDGEWTGDFGGSLSLTSLNENVTATAEATLTGSVDVDAKQVTVNTAATLDLGVEDKITLSETALTLNFTITNDDDAGLSFAISEATAAIGTLSVGSLFAASEVSAELTGLEISGSGVALGAISLSASSATILPDNDLGITATTTGFTGSYDFSTDPATFELTAEAVSFELADKVSFNATEVSLTPNDVVIFAVATVSVDLPGLGVSGEVIGFELASDGTPSATSVSLDTSGLADSLGLGGVLPFNIDTIALNPPGEGERVEFNNFDLTVAGTIDFSGLDDLPFTPTITIDGQTSRSDDDTAAEFTFTVRLDEGEIQIWETPTITLGLEELQIGSLLEIDGSVTLGGYTEGVWGGEFGGTLTVTSLNETVTGSAAATVAGSVDAETGTITVETEATLDLGIGTTITLSDAVATTNFTLTHDETDGLMLTVDEASLVVGTLAVDTILEASDVSATLVDLTVSGTGISLGSISVSAGSATLLPDNDLGITAETTGISGSYDFTTDPDTFELSAESVTFELEDVVSFNATGVSLTPLGDVVLAVDTVDVTLAGLDSSAEVTGFELAADGTPSATSIELDTEGLAESLDLGGILPFNITTIALAGSEEGERITFTDFDLTVEGTIDFSAFADLPFTPYITIGEQTTRSDDDAAAEFSFTVRMEDSALQILDSPTITLGLEDLRFGDVLEVDGSITLGGYTDGAWVGAFGGSLTLTALQIPADAEGGAPTSITVEVSGLHDADAGTLQLNIATAISFGLGDDISFVDAGIEVDFTLRHSEEDGLELLDLGVTATAGSMTVGSILTAEDVSVGFSGFSVTAEGIALGSVALSAGAAALFPDSTAFTATVTEFSGSYDFTAESDPFELTAASVDFEVIDLLSFNATDVAIRPASDVIVSIGSIAVELPGVGVGGSVTGFELTSDGTPSAVSLTLDTSGLADSLPLAGVLPFELDSIAATFLGDTNANGVRDEGEIFRLDAFDLTVEGAFNFDALSALPFTPVLRIGDTEADDGEDTFSFTVRVVDGTITPWDLGPITIGVSDLNVGTAFAFSGSITLGGYAEGEWVPDFGGSLQLAAASSTGNLSGSLSAELTGSIDVETGVLDIDAEFAVNFTLGSYVEIENAGVSISLTIATTEGELGSVTLADPVFVVHSASVERISVNLNNLVELEATEATFDFEATGEEILLSVGTMTASLTGVGLSGTASNFAVAANGGLVPLENFSVSFSFSDSASAKIKWPEWMPIQVSVFELAWPDLAEDPLDFTLRLSASVGIDSLAGTELSLYGSIENLVIDVGALKSGAFPIIGLGTVELSVGGKISSAEVSAGLILGMVRLDADGNQIADDDNTTEVADGLLWGAIRGGINIAGYGGFEIFLGLSEYGPLQGYIKLTAPLTIPYVGIAFTDFRAGITFNSELPSIDDPLELQDHPEFTPTGDLTFGEWSALLKGTLETQIETHAEAGNFGLLLSPFTIEGGVTIFSIYASTASFNIQADFKMDSTGKFLARGAFQLGGTISFTANLYIDMSTFITEGDGTVLFLAELPSELPVATIYGLLSFDFGETVDPENPPAAPFEQFTIRLEGGARFEIAGIPGFVLEGGISFEVALNAPSLHVSVDGRAAVPFLGDVVGLAGDFNIYFGADETVEAVGILALTPADFEQLESIGLTMDALALLRFNTTEEAIDHTLTIPGQSEPRTFTLAAKEASILVEGVIGLAPAGIELFRLGGLFSMTFSENGFDVVVGAELTAGPVAAPLLRFGAQGFLHLEMQGIAPGMAAQLILSLDPDADVLAAIGVELSGDYQFIMNTTGEDVDYVIPTELEALAGVEGIHLPRGPPSADGESIGAAGPYLMVRAEGTLKVLDLVDLEGVFDFQVSDGQVQLDYEATVNLGVGGTIFYRYDAEGSFRIDANGIYGQAELTIDSSIGLPLAALGFSFDAIYFLQVNTTNAEQTLGEVTLDSGYYARVRAAGALIVGAWRFVGTYDLTAAVDGVEANAAGSVSLGVGSVEFASFDFAGTLLIRDDGIFAQLSIAESRSAPTVYGFGFSADAGYELSLNTTGEEIDGVAAGLGARIIVTGALELGNWEIDGVYTLNASTTGIGFAASASLIFKAGDDELFRVPLDFEIELNIPGIVKRINLELSLEDLGIEIPGLELSGSAELIINTTAEAQDGLPAGPILQFVIDGQAVIGGLALDGTFGFESTLGSVTMIGDFAVNLGPEESPLLSFTGAGEFEMTLLGVAGYMDLSLTGGDDTFRDFFSADFAFFIEANTRPVPYTLGERELPAGPTVLIGATGTMEIAGLAFSGSYTLAAGGGGVDLTMNTTASVTLDTLTLISFRAVGGLHLGLDGLVAALEVTPDLVDFDAVGLSLNTDTNFSLRINTTGKEQTIGDLTLEAGNYARVLFTSSLTFGVFRFDGSFSLSIENETAELLLDTQMIVELPAIGAGDPVELFRMGAQGGLRISPDGVVAAFELDRGALDQLTLFDIEVPIGVSQEFSLHFNTTGTEQTINDIVLAAGNYLKVVSSGRLQIGPGWIDGFFSFEAADTGLEIVFDSDYVLGIPGTEVSLLRYHALGGLSIKANGIAGAVILSAPVGLAGLDSVGLKIDTIGLDQLRMLRVNTTGEEVNLGEVVLEAGHYLEVYSEDTLSIGVARLSGSTIFRADEHGLLLGGDYNLFFGLPEIEGVMDEFALYNNGASIELHLTPGGVYGYGTMAEEASPITVGGVDLTPDYENRWSLTINTTSEDQTVGDQELRAGSFSMGAVISFGIFGQTIEGNVLFTIDSTNRIIGGLVRGTYDMTVGDWNPFSFEVVGFVFIADAGVAMDYDLTLRGGEGIPGVTLNADYNFRLSTFTDATTINGYTVGDIEVPTLILDEGSVYRVTASGTMEVGGLLLDGSYFFEISDGSGLFDTSLTLAIDATIRLQVGETTLLAFDAAGGLSLSVDGIWGGLSISLATDGLDANALGFNLDATYVLQLNTTGSAQTVGELNLPAGPYARVAATGDLTVGALTFQGSFGFSVGVSGINLDTEGTVAFGVAGLTFYQFNYDGEFALDTTGLYASLSLTVGSSNRDQYGFGFSNDATYTLGLNTTHTERDGVPPGLGARVRVEGNLEIGDISMAGVYDLTASTTGIGFAASAALVLRTDDTILLEVPVEFSYELEIPGIVDEIELDISAEDLGIDIPGLDFAGSAAIVINTTGTVQGDIPAGPLLQLAVNGTATVGELDLEGRFAFESSLNRTRMITSFGYTLGDESDPLLSFGATGAFNLGLDGIAGLFDLEITGGDESIREFLGHDLTYNLVVNTTGSEYQLFDQLLPAGPLYQVEAHGDLDLGGLSASGDYIFRIDGDGLLLETEADLNLSIPMLSGNDIQLFNFELDGGIAITKAGIAAALDLTPTYASLDAFDFKIGPEMDFSLAVNTTGEAFTFGDTELEAGVYGRVEARGSMSYGIATMTGLFRFEADTAGVFEMQSVAELEMNIPGLGELVRFSQSGGFRFDSTGVTAAIDLEQSLAADRLTVGGVTLPFTAEQSFLLRVNTTGEAREMAGVELEAGNYFAIDSVGELDLGIARGIGEFTFLAGDGQMDIELGQSLTLGIPGTEIEFYSFDMTGALNISSEGVYGALGLTRQAGLAGLDSIGISFDSLGAEDGQWILVNTTGEERTVGERVLEAGSYIEFENTGAMNIGVVRTEGLVRLRAGSEGLIAQIDGVQFLGLPAVGDFDGLTLFEAGISAELNITSEGVWGYAQLTQTREAISVGGVNLTPDFTAGVYLQLNTTDTERTVNENVLAANAVRVAGAMDLDLLGSQMSGHVVMTVDSAQGFGAIAFEGSASIGIGDWRPFSYDASGFILIGEGGAAANLDLTLNDEVGLAGVTFDGTWTLRASTMDEGVTIAGFSAAGLVIPEITVEAGNMLRTHMSGSITVLGGLTIEGEFDLAAGSLEFAMNAKGSVSFMGTTAHFDGLMYIHPDRGFVANLQLDWGGIDNAFMEITGQAYLRINTWDGGVWEGVTANTFEVGVNNATLRLGFTELTGWGAFQWTDGEASLWVDMDATLLPGMDGHFDGFISSNGDYDLNGEFTLALGIEGVAGAFGAAQINLNNESGLNGTVDGRLDVPGGDYGTLRGSIALTADEARLTVEETAFVLLGGIIRLEAGFEVLAKDGVFTITVYNASLTTRIPGWTQTTTVNGWINSTGQFDLNGTIGLDFGTSTLGISGDIEVNVSNSGISGSVSGRINVPGDYGNYSGTFRADSTGFVVTGQTRFVLLSNAVLLEGGFEFESINGSTTMRIQNMVATSRVPGFTSEFRLNGWMNLAGEFNLDGTSSIDFGTSILGITGNIAINVSHTGISGALNGRIYVPGDSADYSGTFWADSTGFRITGQSRFVLLSGLVLLDGAFEFESIDGSTTMRIKNMTVESRIPGLGLNFTVNGWINSGGEFNIDGRATLDVGTSTLGFNGQIDVNISHTGINGNAWGRIFVPGDYADYTGSLVADSSGFLLTGSTRFGLLGGLIVLDGSFEFESKNGVTTLRINNISAESRIPGLSSSFTVSGYIRSDGDFYLEGAASLNIGNSTLGATGTLNMVIRDEGISASVSGRLMIPGDYADFSGTFVADSGGFDLQISSRFALLGGIVILDGSFGLSHRNGTLSMSFSDVTVTIANMFESRMNGIIRSDGFFDLDGTATIQMGHWSTVEISGTLNINIRSDYGVRAWANAKVYVLHQTVASLSNAFAYIGRDGFGIALSVNFGYSELSIRTTLNLEVRNSGLTASFRGNATLWGFGGSVSGWFDSRNGHWRVDGSVSFSVGGTVGASGRIEFDVGHDRLRFYARGEAWAGFRVYWWHPTPKWYDWFQGHWDSKWVGGSVGFNIGLNVNEGSASVSVAGRSVNLRFKGGFRVWLSNVGGSTVFLDVNRNGELDDGEPWTLADAEGNFSFDEVDENSSTGEATMVTFEEALGALFAYDLNSNGVIDSEEGTLYITGGTDLSTGAAAPLGVQSLAAGLASGQTNYTGATVFFDTNGNGIRDTDEPAVETDELGIYAFGVADAGSPWLGSLAQFDRNEDGQLDASEIRLYAVNGVVPVSNTESIRLFRDSNNDGVWQSHETSALVTLEQMSVLGQAAAAGSTPNITDSPLAIFDTDGDGVMEQNEGEGLVATDPVEVRAPLTAIESFATGMLPLSDVEYVFADVNGNGVWDVDEPRVTPDGNGKYTFITSESTDEADRLGRLAPFDSNGNGQIDASEGVFVVQGGTDTDNGVSNPVAASGLASGYGGGIEQTLNPLTALQVSLVDRGMSEEAAEDLIEDAFDLDDDVDISSFDPNKLSGTQDSADAASVLSVGAQVSALVTGGASLLGDDDNAGLQDRVWDSLAEKLASMSTDEDISLNLTDSSVLAGVLQNAANGAGKPLSNEMVGAAATVMTRVNANIKQTASEGGDLNRNLAANKAVFLGSVNTALTQLGNGQINADNLVETFTDEALDSLSDAVVLTPTIVPDMSVVADQTVLGGDRVSIPLIIRDADTPLEDLVVSVESSDHGVVDGSAISLQFVNGGWEVLLPVSYISAGSTTISITVSDGIYAIRESFDLTVTGFNPVIREIDQVPTQALIAGDSVTLDLASYFADADGNATYSISAVGSGGTASAAIVDGQLVVTASDSLSGVEIFDLVATDGSATFTQRFSVITYPTISVAENVSYDANGRTVVEVTLSNPSTQPLDLNFRSGSSTGTVTFAAGEVTQFIPVSISADQVSGSTPGELQVGLTGDWVSGQFKVGFDTYSAVELMGLRRGVAVTVQFTLSYLFVDPENNEEGEDVLLTSLDTIEGAEGQPLVISVQVMEGSDRSPTAGEADLVDATSLEAWSQPRRMRGI